MFSRNSYLFSIIIFFSNKKFENIFKQIINEELFIENKIQLIIIHEADNSYKNYKSINDNVFSIKYDEDINNHLKGEYVIFLHNFIPFDDIITKYLNSENNSEILLFNNEDKCEKLENIHLNLKFITNYQFLIKKSILEETQYNSLNDITCQSIMDYNSFKLNNNENRIEFIYMQLKFYNLFKKDLPYILQYIFIKEIEYILDLSERKIIQFTDILIENIKDILSKVDDEIIFHVPLNKKYLTYIYYLKKDNINLIKENNIIILKNDDMIMDKFNNHKIWIDFIELNNDTFKISGIFQSYFSYNHIKIDIIKESEKTENIECSYFQYNPIERQNVTLFGKEWIYRYNFEERIKINPRKDTKISFLVTYENNNLFSSYEPQIEFREHATLSNDLIYFKTGNNIIFRDSKSITIIPYTYKKLISFDIKNLNKIFKKDKRIFINVLIIHLTYFLFYPVMHKRQIWFLNDRDDSSDDNAKHLFKYINDEVNNSNIRIYYLINEDTNDYHTLKREFKNIISSGSLKHKILYLFTDKIISSFLNESFYNPYYSNTLLNNYYKNLYPQKKYFLQHGVISCDLTKHIKKFNHNLRLIVTSSECERQSFDDLNYRFDKQIVQVLGLPRYDNLVKLKIKKQILFIPSWRSYLDDDERILFESDYYKSIETLINNKRLHNLLKEYDYELIFKAHPELIKHINLFNSKIIKIDTETSFQKLFGESALLISDFSSVVFDFAYLKKPVIYYQPNDDYHYEMGYFDHEEMGFGRVIKNEDVLVEEIEEYMMNDCKMEDKYKQRVKDFFKFHDKNNSKRVYEWIKND